jgi:phosphatidylserine/phosphatidylglycerophosphate/cardiolipin synthase-like enzyme
MPARKCAGIKTAASTAAAILLLATVALLVTSCAAPQPASKPAALALTDSKKAALPPIDPKPAAQSPNSTIAPAIEVYFSNPLDGIGSIGPEAYLVQAIDAAQISVDMAIYNLSLENVASALIRARQRGVKVAAGDGVGSNDRKQPLRWHRQAFQSPRPAQSLMHDKFTVIDNKEVWTGSMNYTTTSAYSDSTTCCAWNQPRRSDYTVEFAEMFSENLFGPYTRRHPYPRASISSAG